jgi:hypothetical protein
MAFMLYSQGSAVFARRKEAESVTANVTMADAVMIQTAPASSSKVFAATIFASSSLLFLIEPMAAKQLLPWFGGGAAVWATCLVFFQCVLLLGYFSAFLLARIRSVRSQLIIQSSLVLGSALVVWARFFPTGPIHSGHPAADCLLTLTRGIGLPYFVLSTTTPLLQSWCSLSQRIKVPYRLYALSNLASLVALLAYPFEIERYLGLNTQLTIWGNTYIGFALLFGGTAIQVWRNLPRETRTPGATVGQTGPGQSNDRISWVCLAVCSSALLMAVTNILCQQIAPIPLLWITPLAVYLVTFVLCFEREQLFQRRAYQFLAPLALVGMVWVNAQPYIGMRAAVGISLGCLFLLCMFCHGQLAALKPAASHLTQFYLYVSLGGALGALFVGLFAPAAFRDLFEMEIGIAFCLVLVLRFLFGYHAKAFLLLTGLLCIAAVRFAGIGGQIDTSVTTYRVRNFYGALFIREFSSKTGNRVRVLVHGGVLHGAQALAENEKRKPLTYYSPESGIGFLLAHRSAPRRIGVVGLGTGTLAAYGQPGDEFRFYEINPLVIALAHSKFSYLHDSKAHISIREGDARLSLEQEGNRKFDVLVLDAFSGDSVPVHLLTEEAFACYLHYLNRTGILAVHISNNYLDLRPVLADLGAHFNLPTVLIHSRGASNGQICPADWVFLTQRQDFIARAKQTKNAKLLRVSGKRLWTDQYSNLLQVLK